MGATLALIGAVFMLLVFLITWIVKRAERHGKREAEVKQATVNAELMERSEDVAQLPGPDTSKLGNYWNRMRRPRK